MNSQVVAYELDDSTVVKFEVEPSSDFHPAGPGQVFGRVADAVAPAVEAAREVLDKVKEVRPCEVEVRFGIRVTGEAHWLIAKGAAEGNFEIVLNWKSRADTEPAASTVT